MAQPTASDVHVNAPLTQMSVAYMQDSADFVADKVFPLLPVSKQSDRYYEYKRENWFRSSAKERAPGSESAGGGWELDNIANYFSKVFAVHKDVDDQIRQNQDAVLNMDRDATRWVTQQLLLKRDLDWATNFFTTGKWGADVTPASLWSSSLSKPIEDIRAQMATILKKTGKRPNTMVFGHETWQALQDHPSFLERIKYTQKGIVDTDLLAAVLGLDKVVVAHAIKNTAQEAATSQTYDFVLGKHALLVYAAPTPSLMEASGGYIFSWTGLYGGDAGIRIKRFRMDPLSADRVEGEMAYDMKVVAPDVGVFFNGAVA